MRVSREQVTEHRRRILDAAARLFRERGFEGVAVAEIMQAAGLTHGAFYGHFASKDELIAQAFAHVLTPTVESSPTMPPAEASLTDYAAAYLSVAHRDDPGTGCLFAALGSEAVRASADARHTLTASTARQIEALSKTAPGRTAAERRRAAITSWSSMIGALLLSRIVDDAALSDEILTATRRSLGAPSAQDRRVNSSAT